MRIALSFIVLVAACGGNSAGGDDAPSSDAMTGQDSQAVGCATDGDCNDGQRCEPTTSTCIGGCGGTPLDLTYVPANLGLVVDRSCSMKKKLEGTQTTKWEAAVGALGHVLDAHPDDVRWGMTLFPDTTGETCSQDANAFGIGPGNATLIRSLLDAALTSSDSNYPDGPCTTNIDSGIAAAALDPALNDPTRKSYLMLVSDGAQSNGCDLAGGNDGTEAAIADLLTARGVPTFVVGFGSEVNATQLDRFATAGGTALAGTTKYYQADDAAQLDDILQSISGLVVGCQYSVAPAPPSLDQTWVYFGNTELVPRDTTQAGGWDYDEATQTLTFYGSYCERLTSHAVVDIDVLFGCPTPPIL